MRVQIDCLVAGELAEEQRRQLFDWCDQDPIRWRQCALAFLEAQTWQQGVHAWTENAKSLDPSKSCTSSAETQTSKDTGKLPKGLQSQHAARWTRSLVMAASLMLAFCAGTYVKFNSTVSQHTNQQPSLPEFNAPTDQAHRNELVYVSVPVHTNLNPSVPSLLQIPMPVRDATVATPPTEKDMPEHVRKQWERQGYEVAKTERFLTAKLPDGRDVVVPVSGLAVKYVGKNVY